MTYARVNWEDLPSTNTPINATNLNKMDKGIYDNSLAIDNAIESGSNENGSYIKFNDDTLIQWGKTQKNITLNTKSSSTQWYYDDGYKINLPVSFVDNNYFANVSNYYSGNITLNVYSINSRSASNFEFSLSCSIAITNTNAEFGWFAIGRWK